MKIVYIITGLATGGAEFALFNLLRTGLPEENDVHVISLGDEGEVGPKIRNLGIPVSTINIPRGIPSVLWIWRLRKFLRVANPDIIVGWMYHGNICAKIAKMFVNKRVPLVWNVRHSLYDLRDEKLITRYIIRFNKLFSKSADSIIYNSTLAKKQHEKFGFSSNFSDCFPNGIDTCNFSANKEAGENLRKELKIPRDAHVVGHVARFHPLKDHKTFLNAAISIATQCPSVHFILVGRGVHKENHKLQPSIPKELQNRFHLLGERTAINDLMNCMDIFCQSSFSEAFPNVLGEAMATEIPCVATDVGDSSIIVGETGLLVPTKDTEALVDGISKLISMRREDRRQLGTLSRKRIEEKFTLESMASNYFSLYQRLVEKRGTK